MNFVEFIENPFPGKFIVFEGIDKSGKDTQIDLLYAHLKQKNLKIYSTFEPTYDNLYGKSIRFCLKHRLKLPQTFFQWLYWRDRKIHLPEIEHLLRYGFTVICNRYFFPL